MGTIFQKNTITEPALFTPFDTTKKIEGFPEICVSTFSENIIQKFASLKSVEKNYIRPMELCLFIKLITKIRILHFIYPE